MLHAALGVFWQRGYHNVSVRELAAAMGINVATLYSEFGDKERLYNEALTTYENEHVPAFIGALEQPGADLDTIVLVLTQFAGFAESGDAPGCLITNSAIEQAPRPDQSESALLRYTERLVAAYANALGDRDDAQQSAHGLAATTLGLFVLIRAHAPAAIAHQVVNAALANLSDAGDPSDPGPPPADR